MSFLTFFQQLGKKGSSKKEGPQSLAMASGKEVVRKKKSTSTRSRELLYFDLFYQLSYMSAISSSGIPRNSIFEFSAQLPGRAAVFFKEIDLITKHLGYDYSEACRIEGESVDDELVRNMLLRLSGSLSSGEAESDFLGREADVFGMKYADEYERKLDNLKQWTDAYSALTISAVLIVIVGLVSTMIWSTDIVFILSLVGLTMGITIVGSWLILLMSPKELVPLPEPSSREQKLMRVLLFIFLPAAVVMALLITSSGAGLGWALVLPAMIIFPIGYVAVSDDRKVAGRDRDIGAFMRSLGGVSAAIGSTVTEGINRLDLRSSPALREETTKLRTRLGMGILPSLCWRRFVLDNGSLVVNRCVGMFRDAMALGADAESAGNRASAYSERLHLLRAKRKLVSRPFGGLTFVMHAAIVLLLVFVTQVMGTFGTMIAGIEQDIPGAASSSAVGGYFSFNFEGLQLMSAMIVPVILVLTVVNALTPKVADGGHKCKFLYNLSITMTITGICMIIVPYMTDIVFGSVAAK